MEKIPFRKLARPLLIAGGAGLALLVAGAHYPAARDAVLCSVSTDVQFSPGGTYRAQKIEKACLGQAADRIEIAVDKQEKDGWAMVLPLEYDARSAAPAMKWKNGRTLEVTVYSSELTGSVARRMEELTVTRRYVNPPKKSKAAPDA